MSEYILKIKDLSVAVSELSKKKQPFLKRLVNPEMDTVQLLKNVNLNVKKREVLGIVGESGSGKSLTVKSILGLNIFLPGILSGEIIYYNDSEMPLLRSASVNNSGVLGKIIPRLFKNQKYETSWHLRTIDGFTQCPDNYVRSDSDRLFLYSQNSNYVEVDINKCQYDRLRNTYSIPSKFSEYENAYLTGWAEIPHGIFNNEQIRKNLTKYKKEGNSVLGKEISIILQDPVTFLNPYWSMKRQIYNLNILYPEKAKKSDRTNPLLGEMRLDNESFRNAIPRELSGGQAQRAMIILARLTEPNLLIADEPTTGLDVTLKREVVKFLKKRKKSMIFISHDLNMVRHISNRINVMYNGEIVENCPASDFVIAKDHHPYTKKLIGIQNSHYEEYIEKDLPNLRDIQKWKGCNFALQNCPLMDSKCKNISPPAIDIATGEIERLERDLVHWIKCWRFLPDE